jgi:hypothetical protein
MNERIKLLAEQAAHDTRAIHNNAYWRMQEMLEDITWREKFAELIVKECIAQARSEEDRFYGLGEDDLALTMEHFQEVLKHHFGVKE